MTGLLFTVFFFPLVGLAIFRSLAPLRGERVVLSAGKGRVRGDALLAGLGGVGLVLFVAMVWHVPMVFVLIVLGVAAILGARPLTRPFAALRATLSPLARDEGAEVRVPTVLMLIPFAILFAATIILPLVDYDGRAFWLLKAKAVVHEDAVDGPFFLDQGTYSPRNEYPLLVSMDAAAVMKVARSLDDRHIRWIYLLFALGFALELRRRIGAWPAAVFAWLPQVITEPEGSALSAYSDIALGAFLACAFFELLDQSPMRFGMWVAFLSLTKSEGLPIAVFLLIVGAFVFRKRIGIALVLPVIAIAHLFIWRARIAPTDEPQYHLMLADLPRHLENYATVLGTLLTNIWELRDWGLVLIAAAIAVVFARDRASRLAVAIIAAVVLLYGAVLAVANWPRYAITSNIAPRLATHLLGPALFVLASAVRSREVDESLLDVDAE